MAETKAGKADILAFMKAWGNVTPRDLVYKFGFTLSYARKRLTILKKQGLAADSRSNSLVSRGWWIITAKGEAKGLYFHEKGLCSKEWCRHSGEHGSANARSAKKHKAVEEQKAAYLRGFKDAESRYKISYSCSKCGQPVDIDTPEEKEFAKLYMEYEKWAHVQCLGEESGRKTSITAISNRLKFLMNEMQKQTADVKKALKLGIKREQMDMNDFNKNYDEYRRLLLLLPANEQLEFIKRSNPLYPGEGLKSSN
jgi:hypothetical protein